MVRTQRTVNKSVSVFVMIGNTTRAIAIPAAAAVFSIASRRTPLPSFSVNVVSYVTVFALAMPLGTVSAFHAISATRPVSPTAGVVEPVPTAI